jgi:hypothetical protein
MANANLVRYYMTHMLGIPAVASRAIIEEGLVLGVQGPYWYFR